MEYLETFDFFKTRSSSSSIVHTWEESRNFFRASLYKDWIYLIGFTPEVYAWGTASKLGDRLKKTGLLQSKLTGKYDRRVDYLMLKILYGNPVIHLFEFDNKAREVEQERRVQFYGNTSKGACIRGFRSISRDLIAREIYEEFCTSDHYQNLPVEDQVLFQEFVEKFWLNKLKHPDNPTRTFYYGDCLEPNFISRTLNRPDIAGVVERVLGVEF